MDARAHRARRLVETPVWQAADQGAGLLILLFRSSSTSTGTVLSFTPKGASVLSVEGTNPTYELGPPLPYDRWFHVSLDFRVGGTLTYVIDGKTASRTFAAVTPGASPYVSLQVGMNAFNTPGPAMRGHFDNVVLDLD